MEWSADFSYGYYKRILSVLSSEFECVKLADIPKIEIKKPVVCLRHDIDLDPEKALRMAEIEQKYGFFSTYYVMINSPLYNLEDHLSTIYKLIDLGNEIGLHFYRKEIHSLNEISLEVEKDCEKLEKLLGIRVRTVSFHKPPPQVLRSSLYVGGRVNAYSAKLMDWYISDSKGRFRVGDPIEEIKRRRCNILQLLTHPIWWGEEHASANERIKRWFKEKTIGFNRKKKEEFARKIYEEIGVEVDEYE